MSFEDFKSNIQKQAVEDRWRPDQIQYAEDYIDDLYKKGIKAKRQPKLDKEKADYIQNNFEVVFPKKSD